uniref:Histidine N-acetyltransferase-like n=1 Tax=Lepisosteus oculatus TaxID=7918 RepID=W5MQ95_LEPOC|nr:PREDICTED: histidine N-acetyltransferase-like [Lepisosteus oculatus]
MFGLLTQLRLTTPALRGSAIPAASRVLADLGKAAIHSGQLELEFCPAREEDMEQVLAISDDCFSGLDYMAETYHHWLREPDRFVFLAKKHGRVIALGSALLVDGRRTAIGQGVRVDPAHRSQGVAFAVRRHLIQFIKTYFPQVTTNRWTMETEPRPDADIRLLAREAVLTLCCEVADLGPFLQELGTKLGQQTGGGGPQPVTLSQVEAERLVLSHHVVQNLLPAGTIMNDWEPFQPLESNLEILRRRGLTWVADRAELPSALSLCTTPHRVPYRADALHFNINIFSGEQTPARAVLLAQLQGLLPSLRGYVIFGICLRPCLWAGMRDFCRSSSGVSFFQEHWEQLLLERDL